MNRISLRKNDRGMDNPQPVWANDYRDLINKIKLQKYDIISLEEDLSDKQGNLETFIDWILSNKEYIPKTIKLGNFINPIEEVQLKIKFAEHNCKIIKWFE